MKIKSFPALLKQLIFSTYLGLMAVLKTDGVSQYRARDTRMLHNYTFGSANTIKYLSQHDTDWSQQENQCNGDWFSVEYNPSLTGALDVIGSILLD